MTRPPRAAIAVAVAGLALLAAGCGTASQVGTTQTAPSNTVALATAITTPGGSWAVAVAGGPASSHNNFWQLLSRPATSRTWRLVTPPGVASNGGLVIAPAGGQALTAAFRPSQNLAFTPLAVTTSLGRRWAPGVLDADLDRTPAALAADPATGRMLALLANGTVEQSQDHGATWVSLTSYQAIRATRPGRACRLRNLTGVAFTPAGLPLVGGACARPGAVPIFALTGPAWQAAGPATPRPAARQPVTVLTMTTTAAGRTLALLQAGTGAGRTLTAAWSAGGNAPGRWVLSPPQPLRGRNVLSVSAGSAGAVAAVLSGRAGLAETRPGGAWQPLQRLPPGTQALAIGPGTAIQAIAPANSAITIWATSHPGGPWTQFQQMAIPIQYGSSG